MRPAHVAAAALAALVLPAPAGAAWTATGTGTGRAATATLPTPAPVTASCASTSSVAVSWTVTAGAPLALDFLVERSTDEGSSWSAVATTAATAATSYTEVDDQLLTGTATYVYRVTTRNNAWQRRSGASNSRTATVRLLNIADTCA